MAKFSCLKLPQQSKVFIASKRPAGRDPTDAEHKLVKEWLEQLPQEDLDDEAPDTNTSLLLYAAKQLGSLETETGLALLNAKRDLTYKLFAEAARNCRV